MFCLFWHWKVKFITKPSKLEYADPQTNPDTFCAFIIKACNLPPEMDPKEWWNSFGKSKTREKLTKLRNDRITGLKWEFYGMLLDGFLFSRKRM